MTFLLVIELLVFTLKPLPGYCMNYGAGPSAPILAFLKKPLKFK